METRSPPWLRQWSLLLFHVPPFSKNVYKRFSKEGFGHATNERNNDNNINENDIDNNIDKDVANDNDSLNYRNVIIMIMILMMKVMMMIIVKGDSKLARTRVIELDIFS